MTDWLAGLPDAHARRVRIAHVPLWLAALLARLPCRLRVSAELPPDPDALPAAVATFLKLATRGTLEVGEVRVGVVCRVVVAREDAVGHEGRRLALEGRALDAEVRVLARAVLGELLDAALFTGALEAFAEGEARLASLRTLITSVLEAPDVDGATRILLGGIASGAGLGFHRVALFAPPRDGVLVGLAGVGPADAAEAHRIWESLESEGSALRLPVAARVDDGFDALVRAMALPADAREVTEALAAAGPVVVGEGPTLAPLGVERWALVAPLRWDGATALVFADDRFADADGDDEGRGPDGARIAALAWFLEALGLARDNRALLARVEALARTDPLTGLATRRAFDERLEEEIARATRDRSALCLLLADLDHFKQINDQRGHAGGDAVLRAVGGLVRANVRTHDLAARIGGDELAVLLPGAGLDEGLAVARRLFGAACAAGIGLSVGLAAVPDHAAARDVFGCADRHLYAAKAAGRGALAYGAGEVERA